MLFEGLKTRTENWLPPKIEDNVLFQNVAQCIPGSTISKLASCLRGDGYSFNKLYSNDFTAFEAILFCRKDFKSKIWCSQISENLSKSISSSLIPTLKSLNHCHYIEEYSMVISQLLTNSSHTTHPHKKLIVLPNRDPPMIAYITYANLTTQHKQQQCRKHRIETNRKKIT